jgi:DMSO/TMAO reductase YedYZ heme-binding membrane subunit
MRFEKWGITIWLAAAQLLISALLIGSLGTVESTVSLWVRLTAWMSASLFLLAFTARPLRQFWKADITRWMLKNRRYVGVSAAFAHFIHLLGILWLFNGFAGDATEPVSPVTLVFGGLGFVFYFAMGLTSNDASVKKLGLANWKRLHTFSGYYVWFIFAFTFLGGASAGHIISILFLADFVAALALRIAARFKKRAP